MFSIPWAFIARTAEDAGKQLGLHPVLTAIFCAGVLALGTSAAGWLPLPAWAIGLIALLALVSPFVALARYKGKAGTPEAHTEGILRNSAWLLETRPPRWALARAVPHRRGDDLPHVTVIGAAALHWIQLFLTERAAATRTLLRERPNLTVGIALAREGDHGLMLLARPDKSLAEVSAFVSQKREELVGRLSADFGEFGCRIEVRLLPTAVQDSMCAYDPGRPFSPCVIHNVSRGWQQDPHPVLVVEDAGEQRDLYATLRDRVAWLWQHAEPVWPLRDGEVRGA